MNKLAHGNDHLQAFILTVFKTDFCYQTVYQLFSWYTYFPNKDQKSKKLKQAKEIQQPITVYTGIIFDK